MALICLIMNTLQLNKPLFFHHTTKVKRTETDSETDEQIQENKIIYYQ